MRSFWQIFWLELTGFVRTKALALLVVASVAWMAAAPTWVTGDGTAEGAREMLVRMSLGGVFTLLTVTLLASATGSLARERAAHRLQLTLVRPVRYVWIPLAKLFALTSVGALVLTLAAAMLFVMNDAAPPCNHVLRPVLPSPMDEARTMYDDYMRDPQTPETIRKAEKAVVLRLLEQRAVDHYQTLPTNEIVRWNFPVEALDGRWAVRMRFTNAMEMRQDVRGRFRLGAAVGVVSNITQATLVIPLEGKTESAHELAFRNDGAQPLMLRPRKDIELLVSADAFACNLLRAVLQMVAILALLIAFGLFLSASLGRPVAIFVASVMLIVGEMSPSVAEQYADGLDTPILDRLGLYVTRAAVEVTRPVAVLHPIESLAKDECVEWRDVGRVFACDAFLVPVFLALLAAFVMPRKEEL